jgi:hypothetical protein
MMDGDDRFLRAADDAQAPAPAPVPRRPLAPRKISELFRHRTTLKSVTGSDGWGVRLLAGTACGSETLPLATNGSDACFIVRHRDDQSLAYVNFEEEPGRRTAAKLLTRDKARRIAQRRD